MRAIAIFIMLVTVANSNPLYSLTTGTEVGTTTTKQNTTRSTLSPVSLNRTPDVSTTVSTQASADNAPATPRTPVYPNAIQGWNVPLGQRERTTGTVINRFIIHHTTNTGDESPYFKRKNERSSCPTWYVMTNGDVIEFIDPVKRPSSTGAANNYSLAVETQNTSRAPLWGISDAAHESIAQIVAWVSQQSNFGPYQVDIKLDRTHIIGHNEAGVNPTACPGPSMRMDWIVERAKQIAAEPDKNPKETPGKP